MVFIIPVLGLLGTALTGASGLLGAAFKGAGGLLSGLGGLAGQKEQNPLMSLLWQDGQQQQQQQQMALLQDLINQQKNLIPDSMRGRGFWESFTPPVI